MKNFLQKLLASRSKRTPRELIWELHDALKEKRDRGVKLTPAERLALDYCIVSTGNGEGLAYAFRESKLSVGRTARFAATRGLKQTAKILADAAKGKPFSAHVSWSVSFSGGAPGTKQPLEVPSVGEWGTTDLMLSLLDEDLEGAILQFVAEHSADFALEASTEVRERSRLDRLVAKVARGKKASAVMAELLTHRSPRIRAQLGEGERTGEPIDWLEIPVTHAFCGPAQPKTVKALRRQYGKVANDLLDFYAQHDGCDLFVAKNKPGFRFVPISDWPEHLEHVLDWAQDVTWQDAPDEIPPALKTAIPFGVQDGHGERWLLMTTGRHAGRVLLSDTDVVEDHPRFRSFAAFVAALILDTRAVVGSGGYVSYDSKGKPGGPYYPEQYLHD